jgi:hypothetical protein
MEKEFKTITTFARSAILRATDSPAKLRAGDAWRVYDAALEMNCVREVKECLREFNPAAFKALCDYEGEEIEKRVDEELIKKRM